MGKFRVNAVEDTVISVLKLVMRVLLNKVEIKNSEYILHN